LLHLVRLLDQLELLVADGGPKLDGLLADLVLRRVVRRLLDRLQRQRVQRLHVRCELVVVQLDYSHGALERRRLELL